MSKSTNNQQVILNFINEVINKKFKASTQGYEPREVDETIDDIFNQFNHYFNEISSLQQKYNELQNSLDLLKKENEELKNKKDNLEHTIKRLEASGVYSDMLMKIIQQSENNFDDKTKSINSTNTKKTKF